MRVADVYVEYDSIQIDRSFTYHCNDLPVAVGMRVKVSFHGRNLVAFVVRVYDVDLTTLDFKPLAIQALIDDVPLLNAESFQLAHYMAYMYVSVLIRCFQTMLPAKLKVKSNHQNQKRVAYVELVESKPLRGKSQIDALAYLQQNQRVLRSEFNQQFTCLKSLEKHGVVRVVEEEARANVGRIDICDDFLELNEEQQVAVDTILNQTGYQVYVLHGVTGSGKTEVFLHLARDIIMQTQQVLILVPEIALTPQMVQRVTSRFGSAVAVYHSGLNEQEKYEQFKLVQEQKVQLVVGTRSAIFMPFHNLGLIIMDEEHDSSYKQDRSPKYHCRDLAIERAKYHQCPLILASATPALETYARAYKGVYQLLTLHKRVHDNVPYIHLVNMQENMKHNGNYVLSDALKEAIAVRLLDHEQVIILLNRRGYAPILRCMDCGEVRMCPHCDLALNYHKNQQVLVCHTCGYQEPVQHTCTHCHSTKIKYLGMGTQKLEEYLQSVFVDARIARMDADSTRRKGSHETILDAFSKHQYDILVGTQMIAKGLDIANVTLVGILQGDAMLSRSDYRSVELTFDLLVQASGRSGRGKKSGEVYIQVYNPQHYAIQCVKDQNYDSFFKKEMKYRHLGKYPPYTYLASVILLHEQESLLHHEMQQLLLPVDENIKQLGPIALVKKQDAYRMRVLFKSSSQEALLKHIHQMRIQYLDNKLKSRLDIDVNPIMIE